LNSIKKQGITNAVITYAGVIIGFISLLFIQPNLLKPEELGLTRILIAAASLIATVLPLGVSSITTKFFPYFRDEQKGHHGYFGFMLLFPLAGCLICAVFVYIFKDSIIAAYISQSFLFTRFFDILLPFALIMGINMSLNSYCTSLFRSGLVIFFEGVVSRLLFILIIVLYYLQWLTLDQFIYSFVLIYALQALCMVIYIYSFDKPSLRINREQFRSVGLNRLLVFGFLLTIANISSVSLRHLDAIMIGKYINLEQVGVFAIGAYIALIIEIPLNSLERITNASVSQAWANNDTQSIRNVYYSSVKYLLLVGGLLLVGIITNIHELLSLLPATYHSGATVAVIACVGSFLNIATGVNTSILYTSSKYILGTLIMMLLLVMAVVLNILLIPRYGIEGAAMATAIASVIYNAVKYLIIWKSFGMQPYDLGSLKIVAVIVIAFLVTYYLPFTVTNPVGMIMIRAFVTTCIYAGLCYVLRIAPELYKHIPFMKASGREE
jgi:O-antigen/teichoic acid export membrane protein